MVDLVGGRGRKSFLGLMSFRSPEVPSLTPRTRYHELVGQGIIRDDPYQRTIIDKLQNLHDELRFYHIPIIPPPSRPSLVGTPSPLSWLN